MAGYDRLTPDGKKLFKELKELASHEVHVGYQHGGSGREDEILADIADIAMFNELGTARTPSRPFIRDSVEGNADRITTACKTVLRQVAQGMSAQQAYDTLGAMQKGLIQNSIAKGSFAPNAERTIAKKSKKGRRSDKPLIDTGQMRQSVTYAIQKKGG